MVYLYDNNYMFRGFKTYSTNLFKLALPIIMGNLGFIMIGVGDVVVAGRHSTDTLAAISIATAITNCIMICGIGILATISAILSNYSGEGKDIRKYFYSSVKFALLLGVIASMVTLACIPLLDRIGFAPNLVPIIKDYLFITAFSSFGGYLHCAAKEYLQAFEIVVFPNLLTIFCIFLNLALNILFVFGCGVIPEMGAIGLALSSLLVRYFMGIVLLIYCFMKIKVEYFKDFKYYKDLIKVGLPASMAILIGFTGFNVIALVMGRVESVYAAAHNLMCTLTSVSFMIPLAVSNATAVKVGYSNGTKDYSSLKNYAYSALGIAILVMGTSALIFGLMPEFLVGLFTKDRELINVCVPIIYVLCAFQIFDGLQVTFSGIFKGLKKTKVVMLSNFISYWVISFPLGCLLAFKLHMNLIGFWTALCISSVVLCSVMYFAMQRYFKKMQA